MALRITKIAIMAALMAVCSWITIPAAIPFTLQTFALYLSLVVIGGVDTLYATIIYLLLGIVGLPVFASFNSGIGYALGPTGGFLMGFILIDVTYILFGLIKTEKKLLIKIIAIIVGTILCYALGTIWFSFTYLKTGFAGIATALLTCVVPFLLPDAGKIVLAFLIGGRVNKIINNR